MTAEADSPKEQGLRAQLLAALDQAATEAIGHAFQVMATGLSNDRLTVVSERFGIAVRNIATAHGAAITIITDIVKD